MEDTDDWPDEEIYLDKWLSLQFLTNILKERKLTTGQFEKIALRKVLTRIFLLKVYNGNSRTMYMINDKYN